MATDSREAVRASIEALINEQKDVLGTCDDSIKTLQGRKREAKKEIAKQLRILQRWYSSPNPAHVED